MTYRVYDAISYAGDTALMYETTYGNVEVVQALLAAKADVNAKDYIGRTALMLGSEAGRGQGIALIEHNSFSFKGESIIALSLID